jgi:hypothetical protein
MTSASGSAGEPPRQLVVEWALCGIALAAARFIPVPILDDQVRDRAWQYAVHRTLKSHGRTYDDDRIAPLGEREDNGAGVGRMILRIPRTILLFPVRKYVAIFGAVRGVPNDVMRVVLLGRSVHRVLARGGLADDAGEKRLEQEAQAVRAAYDDAVKYQDFRMLRGALSDGLSQGRGLTRAAVRYARDAFAREDQPKLEPGAEVQRGAERVEELLQRPDVVEQLEEFDRRFDERLAKTTAGAR